MACSTYAFLQVRATHHQALHLWRGMHRLPPTFLLVCSGKKFGRYEGMQGVAVASAAHAWHQIWTKVSLTICAALCFQYWLLHVSMAAAHCASHKAAVQNMLIGNWAQHNLHGIIHVLLHLDCTMRLFSTSWKAHAPFG